MDNALVNSLNELNKKFYSITAEDFSDSRGFYWAGWEKLLPALRELGAPIKVLDLGCGNGRFYEFLISNDFDVEYLGVDNSPELLEIARNKHKQAKFEDFDLINDNWKYLDRDFDLIVAFGVFHHIPGENERLRVLEHINKSLSSHGLFVGTFWQFDRSPSLMKRVVNPQIAGLNSQLEDGDYILDWQRGESAYRYAHLYGKKEIVDLMVKTHFDTVDTFYEDGKSGDMNYYVVAAHILGH